MPLKILHQDPTLIAVDKPPGQLIHPADHPQPDDQVTMKILRDQIGQHVFPVHRLDRPTCGLLLFAKDADTAAKLRPLFEENRIEKTYHAIVSGHPKSDTWTTNLPLKKSETARPRQALTHFKILARLPNNLTHLQATPKTGRFHQIRKHLLHSGHPIIGDFRYQDPDHCLEVGQQLGIGTRMLLQAHTLSFPHPITNTPLKITAPTPALFQKFL